MSDLPEYHSARISIAHWKANARQEIEHPTDDKRLQRCFQKLSKWENILKEIQLKRRRKFNGRKITPTGQDPGVPAIQAGEETVFYPQNMAPKKWVPNLHLSWD